MVVLNCWCYGRIGSFSKWPSWLSGTLVCILFYFDLPFYPMHQKKKKKVKWKKVPWHWNNSSEMEEATCRKKWNWTFNVSSPIQVNHKWINFYFDGTLEEKVVHNINPHPGHRLSWICSKKNVAPWKTTSSGITLDRGINHQKGTATSRVADELKGWHWSSW